MYFVLILWWHDMKSISGQHCFLHQGRYIHDSEYDKVAGTWGPIHQFCYNFNFGLPFFLQGKKKKVETIYDLQKLLIDQGPVYAAYKIPYTFDGHIVLVTGVDTQRNLVYTNNPWGIRGVQTFDVFCNEYVHRGYKYDTRYRLHSIYIDCQ